MASPLSVMVGIDPTIHAIPPVKPAEAARHSALSRCETAGVRMKPGAPARALPSKRTGCNTR